MATVEECEQAFHELAAKSAAADDSAKKQASLNRSISCTLRDLNVIFFGRAQRRRADSTFARSTARTRRCACQ